MVYNSAELSKLYTLIHFALPRLIPDLVAFPPTGTSVSLVSFMGKSHLSKRALLAPVFRSLGDADNKSYFVASISPPA
jgi:hypothetical protein